MRIVLDAMGSDQHPRPDVEGAVLAAREYGVIVVLVGQHSMITSELAKHDTHGLEFEVVNATEVVTMEDRPGAVLKSKPNSSMHVGMQLVADGKADAFVTMGNTGAALSIATLGPLRRVEGVKRPSLCAVIKLPSNTITLLDVGANADSKPEWLEQFAIMGSVYAERGLGISNPRVALLSNGEEEGKGNDQVRQTLPLLRQAPIHFIGNIEPKDVLRGGADVIVADGFVGNVFLKTLEAGTGMVVSSLRDELKRSVLSMIGAALSQSAFRRVRKALDPFEVGGAPLLGVNGVVIIGHGRTNANGVKNGIRQAKQAVEGQLIEQIRAGLTRANAAVNGEHSARE
ncbi:MAG TPA: phosphate acyltransferase PlsX [Candidatus Limnocylindrales bacterium]|nr:phosphate acyltransferase PlsX [Candidatus Limnocylindrales bacterium]